MTNLSIVPSLPIVSRYTSVLGSSIILTNCVMGISSITARKYKQPSVLSSFQTDLSSIIESSISIILSSLPSTTKLFHVYIEPTQMYQSLRSRLGSSRGTENDSLRNRSNPTIGSDPKPAKKKRDPYSINLPTTFFSTNPASVSENTGLELSLRKNGNVQTHASSSGVSEEPAPGDIHKKISVEQSSVSLHGSEYNWHDEGGLLKN